MTVLINDGRTYPFFARYIARFFSKITNPDIFSVHNLSNITTIKTMEIS